MWALLAKEWFLLKPALWRVFLLGLPVFFIVYYTVGSSSEGSVFGMVYGFSFMFIFAFVFHVSYQEDKVDALHFLRSLPVRSQQIVGAKFIVLFALGAISLGFALCIAYILYFTGMLPQIKLMHFLSEGLSSLLSVLVVGGLLLWANFRFGYAKMGCTMVILFFLFVAGVAGVLVTIKFLGMTELATALSKRSLLVIMWLSAAAVLLFCFLDSIRALQQKDFG